LFEKRPVLKQKIFFTKKGLPSTANPHKNRQPKYTCRRHGSSQVGKPGESHIFARFLQPTGF
jgi:hypothetical protein